MGYARVVAAVVGATILGVPATGAGAGDKSRYTLFNPTPDRLLREMSTDRPDATESPYTVDAGHIQIEMDLVAYTHDRRDGATARAYDLMPFNFKIGLTNSTDLQLVHDAYSRVRISGGGITDKETGFGDLTLRLKHNIWGNDGGTTAFGIMPFIKIPTNTIDDLNNEVEGGVIVPFAIDLGRGLGLGLMTEVDLLRTEDGRGVAPTFINSAALGFELTDRWGLYVEAFVARSTEAGSETIATLNGGFTYAVDDNLQLDTGAVVGVTEAADDLKVFVGLSRRY